MSMLEMPMKTFHPGKPVLYEVRSPVERYSAMFEDDEDTGYFYAIDDALSQSGGTPIVEAMHVYNVANVTDRHVESEVDIVWSADGRKACLTINGYPHAVADFENQRGYCRSNFPPPLTWTDHDFTWHDGVMDLIR
jgi:hypothetical protein